jgi:branched-chain amino acid transport system substrate-binding protein
MVREFGSFQRRAVVVAVAASTLALAACSSSSNSSTAGGSGGQSSPASSAGFTLKSPVKLALLASTPAQDSWAVPAWSDGANMAVADLNANGGIGGQKVQLTQYRSPIDPNQSTTYLDQIAATSPAGIFGLPVSSTAVALAPKIGQLGIPFIYVNSDPSYYRTAKNGSPWIFNIRPDNDAQMQAGVSALLATKTYQKAGLVCLDDPSGTEWCDSAKKVLQAKGVQVIATETLSLTDTDVTSQALAMKGADLVIVAGVGPQIATITNALHNSGASPDEFAPPTFDQIPANSLTTALLSHISGVVDCVPATSSDPATKAWAARFLAQYKYAPDFFAAEAYDSMMLFGKAITAAKSVDHQAVADALRTMSAYQGMCTTYKSDNEQTLDQTSDYASFGTTGTLTTVKQLSVSTP